MAGKRYSAGAIFLQVVPVFANVQRAIEDEANNIDRALGDQMEKSGEKAGDRAGKAAGKKMRERINEETRKLSGDFERDFHKNIDGINKALGGINVNKLSNDMRREVASIKRELAGLKDVDISAEADFRRVYADLAVLEGRLRGVRDDVKIVFRSDIDNALKGFAKVEAAKEAIEDPVEIEVRTDFKHALREAGAFEKAFKRVSDKAANHLNGSVNKEIKRIRDDIIALGNLRVGIDIGGNRLRQEVSDLERELDDLSRKHPDIDVRFEAGKAWAELAAFQAAVDKLDGDDIDIHADVDTASARAGLFGLARSGDDAANSFRSFNIILLAAAGAGPALVPMLGAIAGGLLAIGPAAAVAGAGLGSVLIGFSGLGDAVTALQNQQDQAAMTAQTSAKAQVSAASTIRNAEEALADARRNAARAAEDAAQRVADAREAAAEAIQSALEAQKEAQEAYRDSVLDVKDAEQALREARRDAKDHGKEIDQAIKENELAIDQAMLDSFNATVNYNAVMADGSATNAEKEQARIDREQALLALQQLRDEQKELAKEKKKWDKEGVDGTEDVQSAQEALNEALEQQQEAYESLQDAAQNVDEARADGAEQVRDALEAQNETLADNRRAVADAARALQEARAASDDVTDSLNAQQNAVDVAMGNLGPAGRHFARFMFELRQGFYDFRDDIQAVLLPAVEDAIQGFLGSKSAGALRDLMIDLARGFGKFIKALSRSFQGPVWLEFFRTLDRIGPRLQKLYGQAFIKFLEGMASIMTTAAPLAVRFARGFRDIMDSFADWAASKEGSEFFEKFMAYVRKVGPKVLEFFEAFAGAVLNIMIALAPYGEVVLELLTSVLDWIAAMDPKTLGAIVTAILVLITASQVAYAVMNFLMAGAALLTSTVGIVVFALVGLGLALAYLWKRSETFRNFMTDAWDKISSSVSDAYNEYLKPALSDLGHSFAELWEAVGPFLEKIGEGLMKFVEWFAPVFIRWLGIVARSVGVMVDIITASIKFMTPIWNLIIDGIAWVVDKVGPIIGAIIDFFLDMAEAAFDLWDELFGHSIFPDIVDGFLWFVDKVTDIFSAIRDAIAWLWIHGFKQFFGFAVDYIKFVFRGMKWAWDHVLSPAWDAINVAAAWLWRHVLKPIFGLIADHWDDLMAGMEYAWRHWLKPAWEDLKQGAMYLWNKVIKPVAGWIGEKWDDLMSGMKYAWERWLEPVFDYIKEKALPRLKTAFETFVNNVQTIWQTLRRIVGAPIQFVINTVLRDGLIAGYNKVADFLGVKEIEFSGVDWKFATGGIFGARNKYADGGTLPGYTPGRDVHTFVSPTGGRLNLSGGEAIMRPEWTAEVGPDFVNRMNLAARRGGRDQVRKELAALSGSYWMGGILPLKGASVDSHGSAYPFPAYDLNYPGYEDYGKPVRAWKTGSMRAFDYGRDYSYGRGVVLDHGTQYSLYAHMSGIVESLIGKLVKAGTPIGAVGAYGNTGDPATSHLHFEIRSSEPSVPYTTNPEGDISGAIKKAAAPAYPDWLIDIAKNPLGYVKGLIDGPLDRLRSSFGETDFTGLIAHAPVDLVGSVTNKIWDILPGPLKKIGDGVGKVGDALGGLLGRESGGAEGHESGDEGSYATGGILPYNGTMKYDNGGYLPPGLTSVVNLTGRPEPVFTADQWDRMGHGAAGAGTIHYEPHFEGSDLTAADVAGDLNFALRKLRRQGKYAGVGDQ